MKKDSNVNIFVKLWFANLKKYPQLIFLSFPGSIGLKSFVWCGIVVSDYVVLMNGV